VTMLPSRTTEWTSIQRRGSSQEVSLREAAKFIGEADALLICTGSGMGVASGLGTLRGRNAAPLFPEEWLQGISPEQRNKLKSLLYENLSTAQLLENDPNLAWSFWFYQLLRYKQVTPHKGYHLLQEISSNKKFRFSLTSNIDGHWKRSGFPEQLLYECHGRVSHFQCGHSRKASLLLGLVLGLNENQMCSNDAIWEDNDLNVEIATGEDGLPRVKSSPGSTSPALPENLRCKVCKGYIRPNVKMFEDFGFNSEIVDEQNQRFKQWLQEVEEAKAKLVILEIGAGTILPAIRGKSEKIARRFGTSTVLIRINPVLFEANDVKQVSATGDLPYRQISLPMDALTAISRLYEFIKK